MYSSANLNINVRDRIIEVIKSKYVKEVNVLNISTINEVFGKTNYAVLTEDSFVIINLEAHKTFKFFINTSNIVSGSVNKLGMLEIHYEIRQAGNKVQQRKIVLNLLKSDLENLLADLKSEIEKQNLIKTKELEIELAEASARNSARGEYIGVLSAESGLQTFARKANNAHDRRISDLFDSGGQFIEVWENVVIQSNTEYEVDGFVSAEVSVNGQIQVTHRPTLTRMGLFAPLPGSALIPGLALQKKTVHDLREVLVTISHPDWSCSVRVPFANLANAQQIANRLNKISERKLTMEKRDESTSNLTSKIDRLTSLVKLLETGKISETEFQDLKAEVLKEER